MEARLSRERKRAVIIMASLAVPFIGGLVDILLTGDQVPLEPFFWWLMRVQQFASALISLLPLAILQGSRRTTCENVATSLRFVGVWFLIQVIAIFVLAIISLAVDPNPYP